MRSRFLLALLVPLSLVALALWPAPFGSTIAAAAPPGWSLVLTEPDWGLVLRQSIPAAAPAALALALVIPLVRLAWRRWAVAPILAVALLGTAALAQAVDAGPVIPGLTPEATGALIGLLAGVLVKPLTAIWKDKFKTEGPSTERVAWAISILLAGALAYSQGAYGEGWRGVLAALVAVAVAFAKASGDAKSQRQQTTSKPAPAADPSLPPGGRS